MRISPKAPFRSRSAGVRAACAAAGSAAAAFTLLFLPGAAAHAASGPGSSGDTAVAAALPSSSFTLPTFPTAPVNHPTTPITVQSTAPARRHNPGKAPSTDSTAIGKLHNYVSTFKPQAALPSPTPSSAGPCLANGRTVTGSGGYLELPGIAGSSTAVGHIGALPIESLGPTAMLPPQIDSASLADLTVTRVADASSTNLSMVANVGDRFACAHIELGPGDGYTSLDLALVNAGLVAENSGDGTEYLTVTYSSIRWAYTVSGSSAVHVGSGEIDQRPDSMKANLKADSKLVVYATIALAIISALFLYLLYRIGKRRNAARYRARYQRRAAQRAARSVAERGSFAELTLGQPVAGPVGGNRADVRAEVGNGSMDEAGAREHSFLADPVADTLGGSREREEAGVGVGGGTGAWSGVASGSGIGLDGVGEVETAADIEPEPEPGPVSEFVSEPVAVVASDVPEQVESAREVAGVTVDADGVESEPDGEDELGVEDGAEDGAEVETEAAVNGFAFGNAFAAPESNDAQDEAEVGSGVESEAESEAEAEAEAEVGVMASGDQVDSEVQASDAAEDQAEAETEVESESASELESAHGVEPELAVESATESDAEREAVVEEEAESESAADVDEPVVAEVDASAEESGAGEQAVEAEAGNGTTASAGADAGTGADDHEDEEHLISAD